MRHMGDITLANVETSARISVQNGYRDTFIQLVPFLKDLCLFWDLKFLQPFFYMCNLQKIYERMCFPWVSNHVECYPNEATS